MDRLKLIVIVLGIQQKSSVSLINNWFPSSYETESNSNSSCFTNNLITHHYVMFASPKIRLIYEMHYC